jgi:hypothetical protein
VHFSELTDVEQRVLGCLIEKRWTTPDQYPLSVNSLRLACNQSTNRDPVTHYDEAAVYGAAQRLCQYGLARLASGHSSRSTKFRHLAEEGLGLNREQLAVLGVLLLRGPQTPGELKQRTERMAPLASLDDVERVLGELDQRGYARRLGRRPGQKEDRFGQLLGGALDAEPTYAQSPSLDPGAPSSHPAATSADPAAPSSRPAATSSDPAPPSVHSAAAPAPAPIPADPALAQRVSTLEAELATLVAEVAALRATLDELLS